MRVKSSAVSTPSAVIVMRKLLASCTIDWMIATVSLLCAASRTKRAVDLQLVEDGLVQIAERGIAGAEIVERDADAERAQPLQHVERAGRVLQEHGSVTSSSSRLAWTRCGTSAR
jgi:nitrogen fixation protein FixH